MGFVNQAILRLSLIGASGILMFGPLKPVHASRLGSFCIPFFRKASSNPVDASYSDSRFSGGRVDLTEVMGLPAKLKGRLETMRGNMKGLVGMVVPNALPYQSNEILFGNNKIIKVGELGNLENILSESNGSSLLFWNTSQLFVPGIGKKPVQFLTAENYEVISNLSKDKWQEYLFINSVDPHSIPLSKNALEIVGVDKVKSLKHEIESILRFGGKSSEIAPKLLEFLRQFVLAVGEIFPNGAHIKLAKDLQTGDSNKIITAQKILLSLENKEIEKILGNLPIVDIRSLIMGLKLNNNRIINLLGTLLSDLTQVMVQKSVEIQSWNDKPIEYRVSFVNGIAVSVHSRYSYRFSPEDEMQVLKFTNDFLSKTPPGMQDLLGGADVVKLKDGSFKFMELNLGDQNGFANPSALPIEGNLYLSKIQGQPTLLIEKLVNLSRKPIAEQINYLNKLSPNRAKFAALEKEIYIADVIAFLRDLALKSYLIKDPNAAKNKQEIIDYIKSITLVTKSSEALKLDLAEIQRSTLEYLNSIP